MIDVCDGAGDGDEQNNTPENEASDAEQMSGDGTATTMSFDPVTMNAPMAARASNYDEAKKKQESASHSDLDSSHPQHLSGTFFSPSDKECIAIRWF